MQYLLKQQYRSQYGDDGMHDSVPDTRGNRKKQTRNN